MLALAFLAVLVYAYIELPVTRVNRKELSNFLYERLFVNADIEALPPVHLVQMEVGSRNDKVSVWFDSRSSQLWFPSTGCTESYVFFKRDEDISLSKRYSEVYNCSSQGTFDPLLLRTFVNASMSMKFGLGQDDETLGYWGTDRVRLGNYSTNMNFGVASRADTIGVLGLGFKSSLLTPVDFQSDSFTGFGDKLVREDIIKRNVYSFLLGPNHSPNGLLLLGAIDHSKYDGTLKKVKMVNLLSDSTSLQEVLILFDGYLGKDFSTQVARAAILESSASYLRFPKDLIEKFAKKVGAKRYKKLHYFTVDCSMLELSNLVSFYFSGIEIEVAYRDLVLQTSRCLLSILEWDGPIIFGSDVLASAYVVVDLDNKEVALAMAAVSQKNVHIEEVTSSIPLAEEAPLYSYTSLRELYSHNGDSWMTTLIEVHSFPTYSTNTEERSIDFVGTTYQQTAGYIGDNGACSGKILKMVVGILSLMLLW